MYTDELHSNWEELKGKVKKQWNKLTDDDLDEIEGNITKLTGHIASAYGTTKDEVKKEIEQFLSQNQIKGSLKQVGEKITENAEKVKENVQQYSSDVTKYMKECPVQSALIAGSIGFLAGYLFHNKS